MAFVSWLVGAVALAVDIHAVVALIAGLRADEAPVVAKHARRCMWSEPALVVMAFVGVATTILTAKPLPSDPTADRAARLAMVISEIVNTLAFTVVGALLPVIAAVVLHVRARRIAARSGR
ncbi:MAG: hypothetical protein QM820_58355 [Minicystis sp.]